MSGGSPGAKVVGKVAIRSIPDTSKFRGELRDKLRAIEQSTSFRVTVDRVRIMKTKVRSDVQRQFDEMKNLHVNIDAHVRNSQEFKHEIRALVDDAESNNIRIDVAAVTAGATAQMKWLSRPRTVQIVPMLSKAAVAKVATGIAALSGGRVAWRWIDNLAEMLSRVDTNLPKITAWASGLTTVFAMLMGSISGILGIGQGLASILPAFLTLPGLILNAAASLTVLIVALKHSKEELAVLGDDMNSLGVIMREGFWNKARQPIIDLVQGLMPQLSQAFRNVADGVGLFTGELANAFATELAGGRLLSIFDQIAEGWRILSTGAQGFAGAIVSLSQIAATYTPRLASWFVRQADTFDAWLTSIANDGRLGVWMEDAIDSMYQLWDVTTGTVGIFDGLWKAAKRAGSGGLKGFSEMILRWEKTVNSPKFQTALTALFVGSNAAMAELGDGIKSIGDLMYRLAPQFENFIGKAGAIVGSLLTSASNAITAGGAGAGLDQFIDGLLSGVEKFGTFLPRLDAGVGSLLGFVGELANQIGPVLGASLAAVSEAVGPVLDYLKTDVLPILGPALVAAIDELGPKLGEVVDKLTPLVDTLVDLALNALPGAVEATKLALDTLGGLADGYATDGAADRKGDPLSALGEVVRFALESFNLIGDAIDGQSILMNAYTGQYGVMWEEVSSFFVDTAAGWDGLTGDLAAGLTSFTADFVTGWENFWSGLGESVTIATDLIKIQWDNFWGGLFGGAETETAAGTERLRGGFGTGLGRISEETGTFSSGIQSQWASMFEGLQGTGAGVWDGVVSLFTTSSENARGAVGRSLGGIQTDADGFAAGFQGLWNGLWAGAQTTNATAWSNMVARTVADSGRAVATVAGMSQSIIGAFAGAGGWLVNAGANIIRGLVNGIGSMVGAAAAAAAAVANRVVSAAKNALGIQSPSTVFRDEVGKMIPAGIGRGIELGMPELDATVRHMVQVPVTPTVSESQTVAPSTAFRAGPSLTVNVHNPVSRDPIEDIRDAGQLAIAGFHV